MSNRIVVIANRLPVSNQSKKKGAKNRIWETSPGGLVSALIPVLQNHRGSWVGWTGTTGGAPAPFRHSGIQIHPIGMTRSELDSFYYGFCNTTIWPLFHDAVRPPIFNRNWWWSYKDVNRKFAELSLKTIRKGDIAWVHDYQLQLVPKLIRERRRDTPIGFFLHIPFPPEELFAQLPWRKQILEGLLGADVVGFQTKLHADNFARAAMRYTEAEGSTRLLYYRGREIRVGAFPISIDVKRIEETARKPSTIAKADAFRKRMGNRRIILGVDRLDYTKGIDMRMKAFEFLLENRHFSVHDFVFVQIVVPSREAVLQYQDMKTQIESIVGRVNGDYGVPGKFPLHYFHQNLPFDELVASYLAADIMLVTPLCDGMNLVSKEYVASRLDDTGVLVLSEFAGAANELKEALLVNPHDVEGVAKALESAFTLPSKELQRRMRSLKKRVRRHDVYEWAANFMTELKKK